MAGLKYIIFDDDSFVIFPPSVNHYDMASTGNPISAGFCMMGKCDKLGEIKMDCYGESIGLNIKSRLGEDNDLIEMFYKTYCK